ncbi:NRDE family protein, partial [Hydrogenophaga sp.]|uniref:NRDE family protein n=1 Tax=Hydrogenophaga sp. TaxID=1904254 RepID=UPI00356476DA
QDYGGFNLVVGDFTQGFWAWVSNRHPEHPHRAESTPRLHTRPLGAGVYGLSNAALDTPWPKTLALKSALASRVAPLATEADKLETLAVLTQALGDARPAPDALLPDTGVAPVVEQALSSAFVRVPQNRYGTRCSTVVQVGPSASTGTAPGRWQVQLDEWTHEHSRLSESAPGRVDFQARQRRSETLVW